MDIDETAVKIHQTAREHGFWDKERNFGEMLMLVTSELAEALEEDRSGRPTVWLKHEEGCGIVAEDPMPGPPWCSCMPKPEGALVEVVDAIIRCLDTAQDLAGRTQYTVGEVIDMKMKYNDSREHMHGKAY